MGLKTITEHEGEPNVLTEKILNEIGAPLLNSDFTDIYERARDSEEIYLIKTHNPPKDNQPAIYVVRDGRASCISYFHFHEEFTSPPIPTMMDLILGADYYGGWSEHYRNWTRRDNTVVVRYEDLVDIDTTSLKRIADFVQHQGDIQPWENPFDQLHRESPDFFRKGSTSWEGSPHWTPNINALFYRLHGELMLELGYATQADVQQAIQVASTEMLALADAAQRYLGQKKYFEQVCNERMQVIDEIKRVSDERLELINMLERVCKERLELINKLSAEVLVAEGRK
jgi:hypothetical protein